MRPLYEARSGSINGQDDNAIEKLAVIVILENEEKKVKEQIKEKDKEMTAAKNDQEKQKIESEKDDLIDKLGDIGEQLIPLEIF